MKVHPARNDKTKDYRNQDDLQYNKGTSESDFSLMAASLRHQTKEFFNNSTLHGVRYIAEEDRPFCEKFMWFSFTSVGAVTSCIIIVSLWEKFQTNPTITGLDTDFHNWDVPFPAVTLCDLNPIDKESMQQFINSTWGEDPPEKAYELLKWLATLSYATIDRDSVEFLGDQELFAKADAVDINPRAAVLSVVEHCESLFLDCEWRGDSEECCEMLSPAFTEMGFCYAFNSRHSERSWPWQTQAQPEQFTQAFIHETDAKWSFVFNSFRNDTTIDVYIHSAEEMAGLELSPQHTWDRRVEKVSFSVKHTYTTEDARQLSVSLSYTPLLRFRTPLPKEKVWAVVHHAGPVRVGGLHMPMRRAGFLTMFSFTVETVAPKLQRRCMFADEQSLETSPDTYTYSACMRQCRMQRCRALCQCVPHFYPEIDGYRYCTVRELECIAKNVVAITDVAQCACELGCTHTVYELEKLTDIDSSKSSGTSSTLETEFVSWPMVRYKREVLFGWVDLLVSFGGIAGLFLGFSLLSGVEIIYYFTVRTWCSALRDRDILRKERDERLAREKPVTDLSLVPWWIRPPTRPRARPLLVEPKVQPPQYSPPPGYSTYLP